MSRPGRPGVPVLSCLMVLLLAAGWVVSGRLVRDTPPPAVAAGRTGASFVMISAISALRPRTWPAIRATVRRRRAVILLAILGFFVYYTGTLLGVDRIGASRVGLVVSLLPCITFAVGFAAFREQASARKVLGTVLAVAAALGYALEGGGSGGDGTGKGVLVAGVLLALTGTFAYALYGYVYRHYMSDVPPVAALPAVTGVGTVLLVPAAVAFVPLGAIGAAQWAGIAALGAVLTAPVFLISHELIVRKGPLFTSTIALVVPFLVRLAEWGLGDEAAPNAAAILFLVLCAAGVWLTVAAARPAPAPAGRRPVPSAETGGTKP